MSDYAGAISSIESGGRYGIVGPTHPKLGRALGKYQVMEANVGPWTEKYVGRRMAPDEFLASPEAQDAVFKGEFNRLATKHGPEMASRAWFAGEGGMHDGSRKDVLGTTVDAYGRKFMSALGQEPAAAPSAGLLPPAGAPAAPQASAAGLLAGLTPGAPEAQQQPSGLLPDQPAPQRAPEPDPLAGLSELGQPLRKRPIDLKSLQAMLQRPRLGPSWRA